MKHFLKAVFILIAAATACFCSTATKSSPADVEIVNNRNSLKQGIIIVNKTSGAHIFINKKDFGSEPCLFVRTSEGFYEVIIKKGSCVAERRRIHIDDSAEVKSVAIAIDRYKISFAFSVHFTYLSKPFNHYYPPLGITFDAGIQNRYVQLGVTISAYESGAVMDTSIDMGSSGISHSDFCGLGIQCRFVGLNFMGFSLQPGLALGRWRFLEYAGNQANQAPSNIKLNYELKCHIMPSLQLCYLKRHFGVKTELSFGIAKNGWYCIVTNFGGQVMF